MKSKIISLFLCLCLLGAALTSCKEKDRDYVESEVTAAAKVLIEKSRILNEIYWGAGIAYLPIEDGSEAKGYRPADTADYEGESRNENTVGKAVYLSELSEYGISDLETLKQKTREIFSETGYNWILSSCLQNLSGEEGLTSYARYYQSKANADTGAIDGLMVYTNAINIYQNTASVEYIFEGMTVSDVEGEILTVSLEVITTGKDGQTRRRPFTVKLIEETNGFRLYGATYATHY